METVKVLPCSCQHEFQAEKYGKSMRVHNLCGGSQKDRKASAVSTYRCTVCRAERIG